MLFVIAILLVLILLAICGKLGSGLRFLAAGQVYDNEHGTRYKALSAEAATAFGLSPSLVIHDELGRVRGPRSPLYEAMETAVGAMVNPLSIVISTQAPSDADLLSQLIDDALAGNDPRTVITLHTAAL